jgi:hypothetical protein
MGLLGAKKEIPVYWLDLFTWTNRKELHEDEGSAGPCECSSSDA